ncbi:MAG: hypothetical protein KatS3mg011_1117 [Acidimicrobiia bacterium]|nr:MAG: hypothetical protein KatS3mg011_1117 [Acidimicrobiia bacterium]
MATLALVRRSVRDRVGSQILGAGIIGLLLAGGLAAYREIDVSLYQQMPDLVKELMGIPPTADVAATAYGAIYSFVGAMTIAGMAIAFGAAAISGEEADGTVDVLLANPVGRIELVVARTLALAGLSAVVGLVLWAAGVIAPALLDVETTGMHVGALVVHMVVNGFFYGAVALAVGAATGVRSRASGTAVVVLLVSYLSYGLLGFVGLEDWARLSPWYYYEASRPVLEGLSWGHLAVLAGAGLAAVAVSARVFQRRDVVGRQAGITLLDRLRAHPATRRIVDRVAGTALVAGPGSRLASEARGLVVITSMVMLYTELLVGPLYRFVDDAIRELGELPDFILAFAGYADMSTPVGWMQGEVFGLMAPAATMLVAIVVAVKGIAGEEERKTMGVLLANPIPRWRVPIAVASVQVVYALTVGAVIFVGAMAGSWLGGLGLDAGNVAATSLMASLTGLAFGGLALVVSAGTGRPRLAGLLGAGFAMVGFVVSQYLRLVETLAGWAKASPFYYYLANDPLVRGLDLGDAGILVGVFAASIGGSMLLFQRRDLRG